MRRSFLFLIFVILSSSPLTASDNDVEAFAQSREWQKLLHMDKTLLGPRSRVDGLSFFVSFQGPTDPQAELSANLAELARPDSTFHCRFPLREKRLRKHFSLPESEAQCHELETWLKALNAKSIQVIFASAFPEAPPSMFGHSFLQLSSRPLGQAGAVGLMDHGLNFAAAVPPDAGIEMAYKGLFGGYEGHFTVAPFYQMLGEYSHTEERDLWIYELNFSEEETTDLLMHIWEIEMNHSYLSYYFIDENCALQLLGALEAIRPNAELTSKLSVYSLPLSSLRILQEAGLLSDQQSVRKAPTKLNAEIWGNLSPSERSLVKILTSKDLNDFPEVPTKLLDISIRRMTAAKQSVRGETTSSDEKRLLNLLKLRSERRDSPSTPASITPSFRAPDQPLLAHRPRQFRFAFGGVGTAPHHSKTDRTLRSELTFKPALHDILARGPGYGEGMHLDVLPVSIRMGKPDGETKIWLQKLTLIDIGVLAPISQQRAHASWHIQSHIEPEAIEGARVTRIVGHTGATGRLTPRVIGYALIGVDMATDPSRNYGWAGPEATFGIASADAWDPLLTSEFSYRLGFETAHVWRKADKTYDRLQRRAAGLEIAWSPAFMPDSDLRIKARHLVFDVRQDEIFLSLGHYF